MQRDMRYCEGSCLLHPAILKRYEEQLGRLEEALAKGVCASDGEATEAIRDLVETVTVLRDPGRPSGVAVEIAGRLNALLGEKAYPNQVNGVWGKMVAGGESTPDPNNPILVLQQAVLCGDGQNRLSVLLTLISYSTTST